MCYLLDQYLLTMILRFAIVLQLYLSLYLPSNALLLIKYLGPGKNPKLPVSSYFHIYEWGYFRLGYVRLNECPVGLEN